MLEKKLYMSVVNESRLDGKDAKNDFIRMIKYHIDNDMDLFVFVNTNGTRINMCKKPATILMNDQMDLTIYFENDDIWMNLDNDKTSYVRGDGENEFLISSGDTTYVFSDGDE